MNSVHWLNNLDIASGMRGNTKHIENSTISPCKARMHNSTFPAFFVFCTQKPLAASASPGHEVGMHEEKSEYCRRSTVKDSVALIVEQNGSKEERFRGIERGYPSVCQIQASGGTLAVPLPVTDQWETRW